MLPRLVQMTGNIPPSRQRNVDVYCKVLIWYQSVKIPVLICFVIIYVSRQLMF